MQINGYLRHFITKLSEVGNRLFGTAVIFISFQVELPVAVFVHQPELIFQFLGLADSFLQVDS